MNKPWKAVTIYDIAHKLGISASTVSRALNDNPMVKENTRELVRNTAAELGFEFENKTGPVTRNGSRAIGVIIPFLDQDGMAETISGILDTCDQVGYEVIIAQSMDSSKKESELLRNMFTRRVDGLLICLAAEKKEPVHLSKYQQFNIPVCSFLRTWNGSYGGKVRINDLEASYQLTSHLITEGCLAIGYVAERSTYGMYKDRIDGYRAALRDHGIPFTEDLIFHTTMNINGGENIADQIALSERPVDGLIFADDSCAIGCMNALKEHGKRIPEDIAVASFNATGVARLAHPPLTVIDYPHYRIGQLAANQLINEFRSKRAPPLQAFSTEVGHELVVRRSSQRTGNRSRFRISNLRNEP